MTPAAWIAVSAIFCCVFSLGFVVGSWWQARPREIRPGELQPEQTLTHGVIRR